MADYWKSNERKYCDICKCWLSDNKASISFHENGKRHKINLAKRITDVRQNSEKAERERQKMEKDIRKMEEAAMHSYARDMHSNADLTARSLSVIAASFATTTTATENMGAAAVAGARAAVQVDPMRLPGNSDDEDETLGKSARIAKVAPETVPNASLWVEGKSDEGHTYYWNVKTNESVWQAPKEGYLSYAEYERLNEIAVKQQEMQQAAEAKKFRENVNEEVARYNREKLKLLRKPEEIKKAKKEEQELQQSYKTAEEAAAPVMGGWQTVVPEPEPEHIDLQLPERPQHYYQTPIVAVTDANIEPPVKRFKEKTMQTLDAEVISSTSSCFKKRKFAAKGNARQRLDDE